MARLIHQTPGFSFSNIALARGTFQVGRKETSHVPIDHPSVSGLHCELQVQDNQVYVKDLGSTNGTYIDGQPVRESPLKNGQRLRVGAVEFLLDEEGASPGTISRSSAVYAPPPLPALASLPVLEEAPPEVSSGPLVCRTHVRLPATNRCPNCQQLYCDKCVTSRRVDGVSAKFCPACRVECEVVEAAEATGRGAEPGESLVTQLPGIFAYPFRGDGWMLLAIGSVLFIALSFLARYSIWMTVVGSGYLIAYMQKILVYTAQGEKGVPDAPDFSEYWSDIIWPFLLFVGTCVACFLPGVLAIFFLPAPANFLVAIALLVLGGLVFPMAIVAVAMSDSFGSLNPIFLIASVIKIPGAYIIGCISLTILAVLSGGVRLATEMIPNAIAANVLSGIFYFYFLILEMRVLGLMYYCNRHRLKWF